VAFSCEVKVLLDRVMLKASFGPRITRSNQNSKFSWGKIRS